MTDLTFIVCVIANDATKKNGRYVEVGPNFEARLNYVVSWVDRRLLAPVVWAFGAGTDEEHRRGPTLARVCEAYLRRLVPYAKTITNDSDHQFYGTHEEIEWIVRRVAREYRPDSVRFMFFTQERHMGRVQLIWGLFYEREWGQAVFEVTPHAAGHDLRDSREWLKKVMVVLTWLGLRKPRFKEG